MRINEQAVQNIALGEADNLHQVMMTMERTRTDVRTGAAGAKQGAGGVPGTDAYAGQFMSKSD